MKKHMIWTSDIGSLKDWNDFINDQIDEGYLEEDCSEEEKRKAIYEMNEQYLEDERINLDIPLDGKIIAIGNMNKGRTKSSYLIFDKNINTILKDDYNYGETEYYSDGYNIRSTKGDNHYEYREIREGRNILNLIDRIYKGEPISRKMLNYYTKSIAPQVNKVYGW